MRGMTSGRDAAAVGQAATSAVVLGIVLDHRPRRHPRRRHQRAGHLRWPTPREAHIDVKDLTMAFGDFVVMRDLTFSVRRGDIFFIMGGSGCGKSTLFRHLIGLNEPAKGSVWYGERQLHRRPGRGAGRAAQPLRHHVPGQRAVERDDAGGERRPAARAVHRSLARGDPAGRQRQARAGRAARLRGPLPVRDQRRHAEARRARPRHRARPRGAVLRRALGRARSDQLAAARRPDPVAARQPRRHGRDGVARAAEHLRDRRRLHLPRHGGAHHDRARQPARAARPPAERARAPLPHPRRGGQRTP